MNDGTWSGLRKTIVGTLGTVVAGGGTWLGVTLFGGGNEEPKEETKTEQAAPAPVVVEGQAPTCKHGTMVFRAGTSARGPWRAWMCSAPKGAADKCDPIFLR